MLVELQVSDRPSETDITEDIDTNTIMDLEKQVADHLFEIQIDEDIDANGYLEATSESEKINDDGVNLGCDEGENNDTCITGKVFDTPNDAYRFYNDYSFLHGFVTRKHWKFKNKSTKEHYRRIYVCNKEGFKQLKGNNSSGKTIKRRREVRTGCKAMIRISKQKDGKWIVDKFNLITFSPTKSIDCLRLLVLSV
ncbi:protein FAR1-RELATED SEQUENCE 8-like [Lactuca sativa]|uniref:protein FAR1-RELATED SEQUENCE 8-like n=1 Tax=Lactuca sativa TaxID=4236 RepID=UPI0022AFAA3E|nr:protein FAR1-RELATED SEQUENCE 8-like [Lactuca sativa]